MNYSNYESFELILRFPTSSHPRPVHLSAFYKLLDRLARASGPEEPIYLGSEMSSNSSYEPFVSARRLANLN